MERGKERTNEILIFTPERAGDKQDKMRVCDCSPGYQNNIFRSDL